MKKLLIPFFVFILSFVIITPVAGQSGDYIHFTDNPLRYSNTVITIKNLPVADDYLLTWDNNGETNITYNFEPVIKMEIENPLVKQLNLYKRIVLYTSLVFIVIWFYMTTYYNVPELNYAALLGESYLPYVLTSTLLLSSFIGLWIGVGMLLQTWLQKKAIDVSLKSLGDLNGILQKKEEEEDS